jgi:hypothetical protein
MVVQMSEYLGTAFYARAAVEEGEIIVYTNGPSFTVPTTTTTTTSHPLVFNHHHHPCNIPLSIDRFGNILIRLQACSYLTKSCRASSSRRS